MKPSFLAFICTLLVAGAPTAAVAATESGWVLHQTSQENPLFNRQVSTITNHAAKIDCGEMAGYIEKPFEQFELFNSKTHQCMTVHIDEMSKKLGTDRICPFIDHRDKKYRLYVKSTTKTDMIAGFHATEFEVRETVQNIVRKRVWVTYDLHLPKPLCAAVCKFIGFPVTVGFPLRQIAYRFSQQRTLVDTQKAERRKIDNTIFEKPTGYKRATNEMAFFINSGNESDEIDAMFADIDKSAKSKEKSEARTHR